MWITTEKARLWLLFVTLLTCAIIAEIKAMVTEVEATPTAINGLLIGELSVSQYIFFMLIFLKFTLLYAVGVLPLEIDLGGVWDPNSRPLPGAVDPSRVGSSEARSSFGRSLDHHDTKYNQTASQNHLLRSVMWDCPLQFVCEVDHWANRDHEFLIESMIAKWLRNPSNHTFHSTQGQVFGGLPETCPAMYPCPFDVQKAVGITIPGSARAVRNDVDHSDPDSYLSLF
ncbi:uncharacterized protein LOC108681512 isoform X3 [Hyalella azteca]|uniref:Uncharacterized protein LOC108681512 isoform X3 n=1 Tax=Hyalella azteca TaxID=294128 RepID=A0A8B7PKU1_HYAAZ|nr:uncharacterized protein LOC108681512 isoform X3 [Hyalella azteca]